MDDVKTKALTALEDNPPEWVVYLPDRWQVNIYAPEIVDYVEIPLPRGIRNPIRY